MFQVVVAVVEELIALGGLKAALSGRDPISLEPLLKFLVKSGVSLFNFKKLVN